MVIKKDVLFIVLILVLIFVVLLAWTVFYPPVRNLPVVPSPGLTDQQIIDSTAALIKANDLAGCDSIEKKVDDTDYRAVCRDNIFINLAKANLDFSPCDSLSKPSLSESCKRDVLILMMEKEKNIAICDKAPEALKNSCPDAFWRTMAKLEFNPELCAKITSPVMNGNCREAVYKYMLQQGKITDSSAKKIR